MIAYFDCFSGISGDMTVGALIDLGLDADYLKKELKKLNLKNYAIKIKKIKKNGIASTKFDVTSKEKKEHRNLNDINKMINNSSLSKNVKELSKKIFLRLAKAESKVHGIDINKIHFHEIGAVDSIIDIVGAAIGIEKLAIEKVFASKLPFCSGFIKTAHGKLPNPAPATAELIKNVPVYHSDIEKELVTPTGAAIITALAENFTMPLMKIKKVGYGAGTLNLKQPNVLRVFIGQQNNYDEDSTNVIETNIDDMNPEHCDYVMQRLFDNGALDVFLTNIQMKKNRPAIKLSVITPINRTDKLVGIIFDETTTFGVRIYETKRKKLIVENREIKTRYGKIKVKIGKLNGNIKTISPEYNSCRKIAEKNKIPLKKVYEESVSYYKSSKNTSSK